MDYVNVAFPLSVNQVFTYGVPSQLDTVLQPGVRVLAPFRRTHEEGVIVERMNETDLAPNLIKNISDCLDETPTFSPEMLTLTKWMADYYVSSWGAALFCAVTSCRAYPKAATNTSLYPTRQHRAGKVQKAIVTLLEAEGDLSLEPTRPTYRFELSRAPSKDYSTP